MQGCTFENENGWGNPRVITSLFKKEWRENSKPMSEPQNIFRIFNGSEFIYFTYLVLKEDGSILKL